MRLLEWWMDVRMGRTLRRYLAARAARCEGYALACETAGRLLVVHHGEGADATVEVLRRKYARDAREARERLREERKARRAAWRAFWTGGADVVAAVVFIFGLLYALWLALG